MFAKTWLPSALMRVTLVDWEQKEITTLGTSQNWRKKPL
jgi:hypothetical protein